MYEGMWNGHTSVCCLDHVGYFRSSAMYVGNDQPVGVGVLLRR
jgi:hypothetical protein